jgi:hypothetical protein
MSQKIQVMYTVPVGCLVDVETGEICDVFMYDSEVAPTGEFSAFDGSLLTSPPASLTARAFEIAESDAWPVWELR